MKRLTINEFIERSSKIHGNKFDYSESEYINNSTKVKIKCAIHGFYNQIPSDHLRGIGCEKCGIKRRTQKREYNPINIQAPTGCKLVPLTKGKYALVDEDDFELIDNYRWFSRKDTNSKYHEKWYAGSTHPDIGKSVPMHRFILGIHENKNVVVDHINHDTLDNRKINLRVCTMSDNSKNRTSVYSSTSKYLGVHYNSKSQKWISKITNNKKSIILGRFNNEIDAAIKYNEYAIILHGEFAHLNSV